MLAKTVARLSLPMGPEEILAEEVSKVQERGSSRLLSSPRTYLYLYLYIFVYLYLCI